VETDVHREVLAVAVHHIAVLSLGAVLGVRTEELGEQVGTLERVLFHYPFTGIFVGNLHRNLLR
jgi:hypothetical protein